MSRRAQFWMLSGVCAMWFHIGWRLRGIRDGVRDSAEVWRIAAGRGGGPVKVLATDEALPPGHTIVVTRFKADGRRPEERTSYPWVERVEAVRDASIHARSCDRTCACRYITVTTIAGLQVASFTPWWMVEARP